MLVVYNSSAQSLFRPKPQPNKEPSEDHASYRAWKGPAGACSLLSLVFGEAVEELVIVLQQVIRPGSPLGAGGEITGILNVGGSINYVDSLPPPVGFL